MKKMLPSLHGDCAKGCNKPQWTKNCDVKKNSKGNYLYLETLHRSVNQRGLHNESLPCPWSSAAQWLTLWSWAPGHSGLQGESPVEQWVKWVHKKKKKKISRDFLDDAKNSFLLHLYMIFKPLWGHYCLLEPSPYCSCSDVTRRCSEQPN